uniref:Uncharacterized protein n=1 Tax=Arion vulgaris TaxID=1028688 RepID=A0A0B6YYD5_9EUPU
MSSQRGNVSRTRTQKYTNKTAFKNDLHDKSQKIKMIKGLSPEGLCHRCKEKIEWKIKYKKYKPLTQPATCVRCQGKTVKRAYYTVCQPCAAQAGVCAKCNNKEQIVIQPGPSGQEKAAQDGQLKFELKQLTERQRRSFFRHVENGTAGSVAAFKGGDVSFEDSDQEEEDSCENQEDEEACGNQKEEEHKDRDSS